VRNGRAVLAVARRDLRVELSSREVVGAVLPFALAAVLLVGLGAGPGRAVLTAAGPTTLWLVVLLAGVPIAAGVVESDRDDGCWDLLRGLVAPSTLLAGKAAAVWLLLALTWGAAALLVTVLLGVHISVAGLAAGLLGTLGFAVVTVLVGVLLTPTGRRAGLLPVLALPLAVPVLLGGVQAAALPLAAAWPWLGLLVVYDAVTIAAAWVLFPVLLEE
jgi:heme exporter protein B